MSGKRETKTSIFLPTLTLVTLWSFLYPNKVSNLSTDVQLLIKQHYKNYKCISFYTPHTSVEWLCLQNTKLDLDKLNAKGPQTPARLSDYYKYWRRCLVFVIGPLPWSALISTIKSKFRLQVAIYNWTDYEVSKGRPISCFELSYLLRPGGGGGRIPGNFGNQLVFCSHGKESLTGNILGVTRGHIFTSHPTKGAPEVPISGLI